jgi:quercetin dioxygenase-like cupin family protein
MTVVAATEAPTFDIGGAVITGLASPSRGAADTAAWRVEFEEGVPSPTHSLTRQEVFLVLEGELTATFGDREETAASGDALIVPSEVEFSLCAKGSPATAICALPVGGQAVVDGAAFTPPWAE